MCGMVLALKRSCSWSVSEQAMLNLYTLTNCQMSTLTWGTFVVLAACDLFSFLQVVPPPPPPYPVFLEGQLFLSVLVPVVWTGLASLLVPSMGM